MIRADKLDKLAELRVIQVLYNIKRKFKGGKYNFEYPSYKDRDTLKGVIRHLFLILFLTYRDYAANSLKALLPLCLMPMNFC